MEYTFISYSRKQLYFAEAIVLHLQKEDIESWFDIQKLEPGIDWESTLKDGYENCQRLVLVASQSALESEFVEVEWATALKNGKEVILAVVEDVNLPEQLRDCVVIDFRMNFDNAITRLVSYLTGNLPGPKDRIEAPGKFPYPLHIPFPIWFIIFASMWPYVWMLAFAIIGSIGILVSEFSTPSTTYDIIIDVIIIVSSILVPILIGTVAFKAGVGRFWKHKLDYRGVNNVVGIALLFQAPLALVALLILVVSLFGLLFTLPDLFIESVNFILLLAGIPLTMVGYLIWGAIIMCFLLNVYIYVRFIYNSAPLLRWFEAGQASQDLRRNCHGSLLDKQGQQSQEALRSEPVSFFLQSNPGDRPMAKAILRILSKAGHKPVDDPTKAQKHLYLITNRTSKKLVEEASKAKKGTNIYMIGSNINWSESLESVSETQFVDLRHDTNNVKMLANSLSYSKMWRRHWALEITPTNFEAFTVPTSVQVYRFWAYFQVAGILSGGITLLFAGPQIVAPFVLLIAIGIFFLVEHVFQRRIPLLIASSVLAGLPLIFSVPVVVFGDNLPPAQWGDAWINMVTSVVGSLIALVILYRSRFWFPSFAPIAKDAIGVDRKGEHKIWGRVFVVITTIALLAFQLLDWFSKS